LAATAPTADVAKKSPRAAKAMAMMPPPPGQSVASTSAKSSYGPMTVPSLPAVVPVVPIKNPKLANNWRSKTPDTATDEEVIAMSDDDYMNAFQMAFFRHKLVQLKTDILVNAGETTEHLREDTVIVPDPADRATIEEEHALELRTRDRERKLLKKIEQSIARIDSGDYGYCDETGEPIGVGRLIARPTATLSLEAQQRRELKQKMFGD
jgi:DnaK suppressor protein